jgi:hypothetical protein
VNRYARTRPTSLPYSKSGMLAAPSARNGQELNLSRRAASPMQARGNCVAFRGPRRGDIARAQLPGLINSLGD